MSCRWRFDEDGFAYLPAHALRRSTAGVCGLSFLSFLFLLFFVGHEAIGDKIPGGRGKSVGALLTIRHADKEAGVETRIAIFNLIQTKQQERDPTPFDSIPCVFHGDFVSLRWDKDRS